MIHIQRGRGRRDEGVSGEAAEGGRGGRQARRGVICGGGGVMGSSNRLT